MLISRTAEYALRSIVFMASSPETAFTSSQLSAHTRVPADYLAKVMQALVRARLVTSQRGKNGGFRLAREPQRISIYDVVNTVDPIERIRSCPLGLPTHGKRLCPLHRTLNLATEMVCKAYRATTIAELLEEHTTCLRRRETSSGK